MTGMILGSAGEREAGVACPHCRVRIQYGDPVALCRTCGSAHHAGCWQSADGCGSYSCAPATTRSTGSPALVVTVDEVRRAVPMETIRPSFDPPPPRGESWPGGQSRRRPPVRRLAMHPLAIVSLVLAIMAAVPSAIILFRKPSGDGTVVLLLGTVFVCLVAVVLAAVALGSVLRGRSKGGVPAGFGLALALGDVVGVLLAVVLVNAGNGIPFFGDHGAPVDFGGLEVPNPDDWKGIDPSAEQALRANVLITSSGFLGESLGSGVIVDVANGQATVLTNRHVIDPNFKGQAADAGDFSGLHPNVQLIGQDMQTGRVTWIAPGGIDLAVVEVPCTSNEVRSARWQSGRLARIGETVFAVGNPNGLAWSRTEGPVSSIRRQEIGGRKVKVIQIQTPLNPGNSGGGLYDEQGFLLGINTWAQDKSMSEGLNFAIDLDSVAKLLPAGVRPEQPEPEPAVVD